MANPVVDIGQVITFYNNAAADLPDPVRLKGKQLPGMSTVLDGKGDHYADVFQPGNRRVWVPLADVPDFVQKAFIAAEDRRFYQHHGIDEHGIIRAFIGNLAESGRPQGGSTITQQVVKNLLVGDDVTYERKIREMIVASRLESTLSKNDILELYINSVYLGRGSWGIEMAARSYFGKSAKDLTLPEGAMLAGLLKGPSFYNPDRHADRAKERLAYVLGRMQEDGVISAEQKNAAALPKRVVYAMPHRDSGFNFVDYLGREVEDRRRRQPDRANLHGALHHQRAIAARRRIRAAGRLGAVRDVVGPRAVPRARGQHRRCRQKNRRERGRHAGVAASAASRASAALRRALDAGGDRAKGRRQEGRRQYPCRSARWPHHVADRPVLCEPARPRPLRRGLCQRGRGPAREVRAPAVDARGNPVKPKPQPVSSGQAQLRARPTVQGAALVLENKTGRILAMAGSFSYPLSQLNRTWQTQRQPGSAIKPITYLTALQKGLQPNTLVPNDPLTLPPIGSQTYGSIIRDYGAPDRPEDYWSPRNADYASGGVFTMRRGLENSINVVTAHLLAGGIDADPVASLDEVCATAKAAKIYTDCVRYYPFVLGAQPVHMIDLAAFYAAVANEGARPQPHAIDAIEANGKVIYEYPKVPLFSPISAADGVSFYQLKTMLQGVVARGTARAIGGLSPYVAGKTGTTEDAVDGWFVGFTNDVTIAVWVGYDNGDGKRRSLGSNATGARVALPIFKPILEAIWAEHIAPKAPLAGPSREVQRLLVDVPIDYTSGTPLNARANNASSTSGIGGLFGAFAGNAQPPAPSPGGGFIEHFRRDADGKVEDTQYQIVSREDAYAVRNDPGNDQNNDQGSYYPGFGGYGNDGRWTTGRTYSPNQGWGRRRRHSRWRAGYSSLGAAKMAHLNQHHGESPDYFWGGRYN